MQFLSTKLGLSNYLQYKQRKSRSMKLNASERISLQHALKNPEINETRYFQVHNFKDFKDSHIVIVSTTLEAAHCIHEVMGKLKEL